jgi:peroxiredoxin
MDLPFLVLSDPDLATAAKFGLVHEKGMMGKDVPRPTTLLLAKDSRKILWMRAADNIRIRPAADEVFEQLRN